METIVVTGCTRGLGQALVDRFVEGGHTVLGCGRSESAIEALSREHGAPHEFAVVDVADCAQVEAWCDSLVSRFGAPDRVINNAALINEPAELWRVPHEEFEAIIDVNLKGVFNVIRGFVPAMVERGTGVIVNFSSGWGRSTSAGMSPYCATKWGIEGMTQALAQDLPGGLAAIPLNPGVIDTEMLRIAFGPSASSYESAEQWSRRAARKILAYSASDNGVPKTI